MIDFIVGRIEKKDLDSLVLFQNGIGYKIIASASTIRETEIGKTEKIYIDMVVREDDISLYGFINEKEREIYKLITTVRGIGPKVAIGILSGLNTDSLISAIRNEDINILTTAPGVGKKTAERIILELKDKTDHINVDSYVKPNNIVKEAEEALLQLGYSSFEVIDVLESIYEEGMSIEELIRQGLKHMNR